MKETQAIVAALPPNVYACIAAVSAEIAQTGIAKDRNNQAQGYKFRGIDDVYNALSPIIAKHKLVILPRILSRDVVERQTAKGGTLFYVTVCAEFDFVSAHDSSSVTVRTYGEAMDSGDKATNKAMSAAYKYAAFQTFCIPTEGDNDADAQTHTIVAKVPTGYEDWWLDMMATGENGTAALRDAWKKSKPEYRDYTTKNHNAKWESLKAAAEKMKDLEAASA